MTKIRLAQPCPIKLNPVFDASGNFACTHCQKNVVDFSKSGAQAVNKLMADPKFDSCGSYRKIYYTGRLGRWQEELLRIKDGILNRRGLAWKWAILPVTLLLIFVMGCRTVEGRMKFGFPPPPKKITKDGLPVNEKSGHAPNKTHQ